MFPVPAAGIRPTVALNFLMEPASVCSCKHVSSLWSRMFTAQRLLPDVTEMFLKHTNYSLSAAAKRLCLSQDQRIITTVTTKTKPELFVNVLFVCVYSVFILLLQPVEQYDRWWWIKCSKLTYFDTLSYNCWSKNLLLLIIHVSYFSSKNWRFLFSPWSLELHCLMRKQR